ncbi:DNA circularization protein [Burkholderia multivorans]|uniref:DNA circularization protein n=2 Tax=Burkholderia multivorans TaxID=87883 RepID=UPI000CFE7EC9|nr:DNA circularization N-terminal domain-containing protein [Burkholderia multivorans]MBU9121827.1 DNA circularization N-terminal domain-containing protein [Burkholderia multivorans]PRF42478.1 multidrug DMT transporter permease [Burkholderia multivorans]PRG50764.1 multidrug DMT transporter permease [Burkholderia multivorans]
MAWKEKLFDASFRGVAFDCQRTEDSLDRDVVRFGVPYVDGEDLEDQGSKARDVGMTAIFFGDDYEDRMNAFLNAISQRGSGELIHPVYGSLPDMQFMGGRVLHDADSPDSCVVEMRFSKATPGNPFFVEQLTNQKADATAQAADTAQSAGSSMFATALGALQTAKAGLRRLNALRDVLSETLGPIRSLVTGFQTSLLDYINFPAAFASDLVGLVSGMTDFRSFDTGIVMSDWNGLTEQMQTIVKLPAAAANSQPITIPGATTSPSGSTSTPTDPTAPYSPPRPKIALADPADVQLVTALTKVVVATTMASVASDVLANEVDAPTLTPDQVEQITNDTRTFIEDAMTEVRAAAAIDASRPVTEPLKDVALLVQQLAVGVIDALPPIVSRSIDMPSNLTLIAFRWYGDYTRSAELLRLNPGIRNPNFIQPGDVLRAYAR